MKRTRLSRVARAALLAAQGETCCVPGCTETRGLEEEHSTPFVWTGKKPDQLMCGACHKKKTAKDLGKIAKAKRLRDDRTQYGKRKARGFASMCGRGFSKLLRKRMDGRVEPR